MADTTTLARALGLPAQAASAPPPDEGPIGKVPDKKPTTGGTTPLIDAAVQAQQKAAAVNALYGSLPDITQQYQAMRARQAADPTGGQFTQDPADSTKSVFHTWAVLANDLHKQLGDTLTELRTVGLGPGGVPMTEYERAAIGDAQARLSVEKAHYDAQDVQAATNESDRVAAEHDRLAAEAKAEEHRVEAEKAKQTEENRKTNITAINDSLRTQVAMGELTARQAQDKATAAFQAAQVQRGIISDNARYVVPAGSEYMPGVGPGGPIANMAGALGLPFSPVASGGTYTVDPNAIAAPIMAAQQSVPQAVPDPQAALANLTKLLMAQGVPMGAGG